MYLLCDNCDKYERYGDLASLVGETESLGASPEEWAEAARREGLFASLVERAGGHIEPCDHEMPERPNGYWECDGCWETQCGSGHAYKGARES